MEDEYLIPFGQAYWKAFWIRRCRNLLDRLEQLEFMDPRQRAVASLDLDSLIQVLLLDYTSDQFEVIQNEAVQTVGFYVQVINDETLRQRRMMNVPAAG